MDKITQHKYINRNLFLDDVYILLALKKFKNPLNITDFLNSHPILHLTAAEFKRKLNYLFYNNAIANVESDRYFLVYPFTNMTIDNSRFRKTTSSLNRLQLRKIFVLRHNCFSRVNQFKFKKRKLIVKRLIDKFFNNKPNPINNINNNINICHNDNHNDSHNDNHNDSFRDNINSHNDSHNDSFSGNIKTHNDIHNEETKRENLETFFYRDENAVSLNFIKQIKAKFKSDFPERNNYVDKKPPSNFDYGLLKEKINASSFLKSKNYLGLSWFIDNYKNVMSDFYDDKYYSQKNNQYENTAINSNLLNSVFKNIS